MNWWTRFLDFISPRQCVVCGERLSPTERSLCSVCVLHLPRTTYQFTPNDNPMAQLFWHLTPVERAAALLFYEPHSEMARIVYDMARYFDGIDVLLPVPLSRKRLRQRGYNQSEHLAIGISDITHLPIITKALRRKHFVKSQTQLSRHERQENVADIFELCDDSPLKGKHVLLVDDICTTGATLIACVDALKDIEGIRLSVLTLGFTKT